MTYFPFFTQSLWNPAGLLYSQHTWIQPTCMSNPSWPQVTVAPGLDGTSVSCPCTVAGLTQGFTWPVSCKPLEFWICPMGGLAQSSGRGMAGWHSFLCFQGADGLVWRVWQKKRGKGREGKRMCPINLLGKCACW
jgi:hypothetical protein